MPLLVSDISVILDLERGELLETAFSLNDDFVVPDLLFERELETEFGMRLRGLGLRAEPLDGAEVAHATRIKRADQRLSVAGSFAFSLAYGRQWPLLTGDDALHALARGEGLDVRSTLWIVDQIESAGICDHPTLHACLTKTSAHPRCCLPKREVAQRLKRYSGQ